MVPQGERLLVQSTNKRDPGRDSEERRAKRSGRMHSSSHFAFFIRRNISRNFFFRYALMRRQSTWLWATSPRRDASLPTRNWSASAARCLTAVRRFFAASTQQRRSAPGATTARPASHRSPTPASPPVPITNSSRGSEASK